VFKAHETPSEMDEFRIAAGTSWVDALAQTGLAPSKREARRLIEGGGIRCDGEALTSDGPVPAGEHVVQVGRRKWARYIVEGPSR
jgi:tyrosyl-tRNA synthetase